MRIIYTQAEMLCAYGYFRLDQFSLVLNVFKFVTNYQSALLRSLMPVEQDDKRYLPYRDEAMMVGWWTRCEAGMRTTDTNL